MAESGHSGLRRARDACWEALARPRQGKTLLREIDGLRFLAILGTILTHESTFLAKHGGLAGTGLVPDDLVCQLMHAGCVGVQLFFAISGFILGLPFAQACRNSTDPPALKQFYWRRVTRIEPPYLLNLVLFYLILVLMRGVSAGELLPHLLASGAYLHNVLYGVPSLVNGVAWSLEVEIQFYLLAPLIAQVFRIPSATLRRSLLVVGTAVFAVVAPEHGSYWDRTLVGQFEHFLVGFLVADLYVGNGGSAVRRSHTGCDVLGAVSLLGLLLSSWLWTPQSPLVPVMILGTFAGAFCGPRLNALLASRPVSTLGGMCYTTYLYHYWILSVIGWAVLRYVPLPQAAPLQAAVLAAFILPGIFLPCAGMFVVTEKPFMRSNWPARLGDWFRGRRGAASAAPESAQSEPHRQAA